MKLKIIYKYTIVFLLTIGFGQISQSQDTTKLYYSQQTGEKTQKTGSQGKSTDKHEYGNVGYSTIGPIQVTITPNDLSIGTNESKTWTGIVEPTNLEAGSMQSAKITANYDVHFSRPSGGGGGGSVVSTYQCGDGSSTGGCTFHGGVPGDHQLMHQIGSEEINFMVYSLKVILPDTICISPATDGSAGSNGSQAGTVFPEIDGATYEWSVISGPITLTNTDQKTVSIVLSDNTLIGEIQLKYIIEGVSYTKKAFVKSCECSCQPVTNGETFGPLNVSFEGPPDASLPDGDGFCSYTTSAAKLTLSQEGEFTKSAPYEGVQLSYKKNCKTGEFKDVTLSWSGEKDLGELKWVSGVAKSFSLTVDPNGALSGSVTMTAKLENDVDLTGRNVMILRKGVSGDFKFNYSAASNFQGHFDFMGITGIQVDIVKGEKILAQFANGSLSSDGTLSGTISGLAGTEYTSNQFKVTLNNLSLDFDFKLVEGEFSPKNGNGAVTVSDIKAVEGNATLSLTINQSNIDASISNTTLKAFSMTLEDLNVSAIFNFDFDMVEFDGSLKAKHNDFDAACEISQFHVESGKLTTFAGASSVKYKNFAFNLENISYQNAPSQLSITAKVEINLAVSASLGIDKFTISEGGAISIGKINGSASKAPVSISFSAEFQTNRFKGSFEADFAAAGPIKGAVDVGAEPSFTFGYFSITAGVNLPLGNSGLKISQMGGKFGFNYDLAGGGNPQQGTYVFGGSLGVADLANLCEVVGDVTVQLGNASVQVTLSGTVNVLKNNSFFSSNLTATYKLPANTIAGSVTTSLKVPSSGWVFNTNNVGVNFNVGGGSWSAAGNGMTGSMFNGFVALTNGNVNLQGSTSSPTSLTGSLGGNASIGYDWNGSTSIIGQSFTAAANFTMNAPLNVAINQSGLNGSVAVNMSATGSLSWSTIIGSGGVGFTSTCNGSVSYVGGSLNLSGNLNVPLPIQMCLPSDPLYFWIWDYCFNSVNFGVNVSL